MSKVGNLTLTEEQKKRTFHLPVEQAVIVPSTSGVKAQRKISQAEMERRVNNVRRFLSSRFGGYTSVKAVGGFILKNGKLVREKAVRVTSFATKKDFKKHRSSVINQVGTWGKKWKQEAIGYEHEGDLFIIEPPKSGAVKVMSKVMPSKRLKRVPIPQKTKLAKARKIRAKNM